MEIMLLVIFIIGYGLIIMEHRVKLSRSAVALLTGIFCWVILMLLGNKAATALNLERSISDSSQIIFFLMGAMAIVELIDLHGGFIIVTSRIKQRHKTKLLWIITFITFFLSAILDNLTTTIALIMLLRKMIKDKEERALFCGMVVIAANAGGAWTVIGDVTTTMLWIGGTISVLKVMINLFLPSIISVIIPAFFISRRLKNSPDYIIDDAPEESNGRTRNRFIVFTVGVLCLIFVPIFKTLTGLPPFMGILFGLSVMWIVTEIMHREDIEKVRERLSVTQAIKESDIASILFFMGILLAISALGSAGILEKAALALDVLFKDRKIIASIIGLASSVVGNVSLVAASIKMYSLDLIPQDSDFWNILAFSTGTGGSIFVIGSAAGVALMGFEKITFNWYLRNISFLAFLGFISGIGFYYIQNIIF